MSLTDIYLVVNNVSLATEAWHAEDYSELLNAPEVRGSDITPPEGPGDRAYPREIAAVVRSIPLVIYGDVDTDGDPFDGAPMTGLMTHRDYLVANIGLAESSGDGTVPATFYRGPDLDPWEGDVTVLALDGFTVVGPGVALVRLDLKIPAGELVASGS